MVQGECPSCLPEKKHLRSSCLAVSLDESDKSQVQVTGFESLLTASNLAPSPPRTHHNPHQPSTRFLIVSVPGDHCLLILFALCFQSTHPRRHIPRRSSTFPPPTASTNLGRPQGRKAGEDNTAGPLRLERELFA